MRIDQLPDNGIYVAYFLAILMGFNGKSAAAISIIGGADGWTSIFLATKLGQTDLLGPIAVAVYSYMSLVPIIQPPVMRLFTTKKRPRDQNGSAAQRFQTGKILFPIVITVVVLPDSSTTAPLVGMLMLGNLFRESGGLSADRNSFQCDDVHRSYFPRDFRRSNDKRSCFLKCEYT